MVPPRRGCAGTRLVGRSPPRTLAHCHKLNVGPSESVESRERGTPGESLLFMVLLRRPGCWERWEGVGERRNLPRYGLGEGSSAKTLSPRRQEPKWANPVAPIPGLRSTVIVSEEGNRKETILDLEHKKYSPGDTERKRGPGPREPGLPERLRMDQDTSGPCLLFQAQKCDKQGAGSPRGPGRGGDG